MTRFITFVSGKGGVGKTTSTVNIGHALITAGKKTTLVDGNLVTPNLSLHLGMLNPESTLNNFLRKEKSLKEVTYLHDSGLSLIPSSPSFTEFQKTNSENISKIFEHLQNTTDYVLIDAPSGLGYDVSQVLKHSDEAVIVVNPNLSSVMDALKTIQLAKSHNNIIAGVILNMSNKGKHELTQQEVQDILGHHVIANVPHHKKLRKSLHQQQPVNHLFPRSKPSKEFKKFADHLIHEKLIK